MKAPAVTVITATYNSSRTLRIAISSILAQSHEDWEAWIIGDRCTDDSEAVVHSFNDARLHWMNLSENHGGQAFPNNEGLRRAKGRYIAYLGHDDIWLPHHLASLITCLETNNVDLAHSICAAFNAEGLEECLGPPARHLDYNHHFVPPSCWLHRRSLVEQIGDWGHSAALPLAVDAEYLRRASRAGKRITCHPQVTLVKIPSGRVGLYSLAGEPPQAHYWRRINSDPAGFERDLLGAVGTELARRTGYPPFFALLHQAIHVAWIGLLRVTEDWPLFNAFWRWRFQRLRQLGLPQRGLPKNMLSQIAKR